MRRRHGLPIGTARFNHKEIANDLGVVELKQLWMSHARM